MFRLGMVLWLVVSISCSVSRPVTRYAVEDNFSVALQAVVGLVDIEGDIYCGGVMHKGYVVTAAHCVDHDTLIWVGHRSEYSYDQNVFLGVYPYTRVYMNEVQDTALLKPEMEIPPNLFVNLTLSERAHVGERLFLIGHPHGLGYSFSEGRIIAPLRWLEKSIGKMRWTQTTATAYPGNSGGPCLNDDAEIVGVASFIYYAKPNLTGCAHLDSIRDMLKEQGL
jgi:S1-C subfamily serine protease